VAASGGGSMTSRRSESVAHARRRQVFTAPRRTPRASLSTGCIQHTILWTHAS